MSTTKQTQNVPTEGLLEAGKERLISAISTAKQVAYSIGEKTQKVAQTLGYKFSTPDPKGSYKYVDPLASPKDLLLVKAHLRPTQTLDKSKPVIASDIHIRKNRHKELFAEIELRRELKHTTIAHDASAPFITDDMCIKEAPRRKIFEEIRQPHELRHVKVNDRSAPVIPDDVHITIPKTEALLVAGKERFNSALSTAKQVAYSIGERTQQVAHTLEEKIGYKFSTADERTLEFVKFVDTVASPKELELVKSHLKATQTSDKSKPVIDTDVHIRKNRHRELFAEIELRRELKPSKIEHDASAPFIAKDIHIKQNTHRELLAEIARPHDLKHVATHDTTAPFIPKDIHIKESTQKKVLDAGKERLNTALTTAKNVAHTIGEKTHQVAQTLEEKTGYKLTAPEPKEEFVQFVDPLASPRDLEEVKSHLKHAQTRDKSKPVIERDVHIKENHHKDLFVEIEKSHDLHHVKTTHDASSPIIDKGIHIKEAPQKRILSDITQHHQLKHVSINDKSAPVIPKDIHIVKKKMLIE